MPLHHHNTCDRDMRLRGSVLLLVLVAIVIMTLATTSYLLLMKNEYVAARYGSLNLQTENLADSGCDYVRVLLSQTTLELEQQGGIRNNPNLLQDVLVIDDDSPGFRGRFTVISPDMSQGVYQNIRYGLENESAKLNLNTLATSESSSPNDAQTSSPRDRLLAIPGMNEEVADAILDWLDEDDLDRDYGAESSYYQSLDYAYQPRNGPISHLDELLMVRGVTPELLYGVDINRNYSIDNDEFPRGALSQLDNSLGELDRGWSAYLTAQSSEANVTAAGEPRINLNSEDLQTLHNDLKTAFGQAEANFLVAYRQFGAAAPSTSAPTTSAASVTINLSQPAEQEIGSLLDLIGAKVEVNSGSGTSQLIESPWTNSPATLRQTFVALLDAVTIDTSERIAGRVNINLASRPVLLTVPGMTEVLADQILAARNPLTDASVSDQSHPVWILADGLVTVEELKPMLPFISTGGDVFSGQIIGFFEAGTATSRAHVIVARSGDETRLLQKTDLSPLGPGFSRTVLSALVEPDE